MFEEVLIGPYKVLIRSFKRSSRLLGLPRLVFGGWEGIQEDPQDDQKKTVLNHIKQA